MQHDIFESDQLVPEFNHLPQQFREYLFQFAIDAQAFLETFAAEIENMDAPAAIYHYTNESGLAGIVGTGKLWLSNSLKMNDTSEIVHGLSIFSSALLECADARRREQVVFADQMRDYATAEALTGVAYFFSMSFSTTADDLTQWRLYADNAQGYAVGFLGDKLEKAYAGSAGRSENKLVFPVQYNDLVLGGIQRRLAEIAIPLISLPMGRGLSPEAIREYVVGLQSRVAFFATRAALFFKHDSYKAEAEYRFLEIHMAGRRPADMLVRDRDGAEVEYREFDWGRWAPNALGSVHLGPAADQARTREVAERLAGPGVPVIGSTLPYRAT